MKYLNQLKIQFKKVLNNLDFLLKGVKVFFLGVMKFFNKYGLNIFNFLLSLIAVLIAFPEFMENLKNNSIPDINGQWELEFQTLESSYNPYIGDKNTYNVFFIGDKNFYKFKGERVLVNGEIQSFEVRDRIEGEVIIEDNSVYVLYDLYGSRKTDGNFQAIFSKDFNSITGSFIGNAAESKGTILGIKK